MAFVRSRSDEALFIVKQGGCDIPRDLRYVYHICEVTSPSSSAATDPPLVNTFNVKDRVKVSRCSVAQGDHEAPGDGRE